MRCSAVRCYALGYTTHHARCYAICAVSVAAQELRKVAPLIVAYVMHGMKTPCRIIASRSYVRCVSIEGDGFCEARNK